MSELLLADTNDLRTILELTSYGSFRIPRKSGPPGKQTASRAVLIYHGRVYHLEGESRGWAGP